jgi:hypothetical protein
LSESFSHQSLLLMSMLSKMSSSSKCRPTSTSAIRKDRLALICWYSYSFRWGSTAPQTWSLSANLPFQADSLVSLTSSYTFSPLPPALTRWQLTRW